MKWGNETNVIASSIKFILNIKKRNFSSDLIIVKMWITSISIKDVIQNFLIMIF